MASATQVATFISMIAPLCQNAYRIVGKIKPSVAIGMACVECAYGTAGSVKHHSYFGFKVGSGKTAVKYWDGTFFTSKTQEEYKVGVHTTISAAFRSYKSMEQAVFNFYELLNTSLYARVKSGATSAEQMEQIKACGYMTSSTEVNSVLAIIKRYGLEKYDIAQENPYREPVSNISYGMRGNAVKWIQLALKGKGYDLEIDGIFGEKTRDAVIKFQYECFVDGVVGRLTREYLNR